MALSWFNRLFTSNSRPAARRRPARVQLRVEALEAREVPTVHAFVDGSGSLEILTDVQGGGDNVTINRVVNPSGPFVIVNGVEFPEGGLQAIHVLDGFQNVSVCRKLAQAACFRIISQPNIDSH